MRKFREICCFRYFIFVLWEYNFLLLEFQLTEKLGHGKENLMLILNFLDLEACNYINCFTCLRNNSEILCYDNTRTILTQNTKVLFLQN